MKWYRAGVAGACALLAVACGEEVVPTATPKTPALSPRSHSADVVWVGNGTKNGACEQFTADEKLTPGPGEQGWLFILTSPGAGPWKLYAHFDPVTTPDPYEADGIPSNGNGSVKFIVYTTADAILKDAHVVGGTSANTILTVSHCAKSDTPPVPNDVRASIQIAPDGTNPLGATHTFTIIVNAIGGTAPYSFNPAGITATVVPTTVIDPADYTVTNTSCPTATFVADVATCTLTVTSNKPAIFVANASATVQDAASPPTSVTVSTGVAAGQSPPATKYFVAARISLTPATATNASGQDHTITATVEQNDGSGWALASGKTATITLSTSGGSPAQFPGPLTTTTCVTGAAGTCQVTFSKADPGVVTINGSTTFDITVGGHTATVSAQTNQANKDLGGTLGVTKTYVDLRISLNPQTATNGIGENHTITAFVEQNDGSGTGWLPVNGASVALTLSNAGGATGAFIAPLPPCLTLATGKCSATFVSPTAGTVTTHASTTVSVGGLPITRATSTAANTAAGGNDDAVKIYVDGTLAWNKVDDLGNPLAGAEFKVERTITRLGVALSPSNPLYNPVTDCVAAGCPAGVGKDQDPAPGKFLLTKLPLGTWKITETKAPAGYQLSSAVQTVVLTLANPSGAAANAFVNPRIFYGCTPGFWQGGAGINYWDIALVAGTTQTNDPQWMASVAKTKPNPYNTTSTFPSSGNSFTLINGLGSISGVTLAAGGTRFIDIVGTGGTDDWPRKAARSFIAAYLNATYFGSGSKAYKYDAATVLTEWNSAVTNGTAALQAFHLKYDAANNANGGCPIGTPK